MERSQVRMSFVRFLLPLLAVAACFNAAIADDKPKWKQVRNKKNVKVYTRTVKGFDFKEFKGVTTIKTSLSSLVALIEDMDACQKWIKTCSKGKLLERVSPQETYCYTLNNAPWPVKDRDAVVHNLISQDKKTLAVTIKITGKPDRIPRKKGVVRVKKIEGCWRFTPQKDGTVEVLYQILNDPGGRLPAWLVNSTVVSQPYHTLLKMRDVVKGEKYQEAKYDFIVEPKPPRVEEVTPTKNKDTKDEDTKDKDTEDKDTEDKDEKKRFGRRSQQP